MRARKIYVEDTENDLRESKVRRRVKAVNNTKLLASVLKESKDLGGQKGQGVRKLVLYKSNRNEIHTSPRHRITSLTVINISPLCFTAVEGAVPDTAKQI